MDQVVLYSFKNGKNRAEVIALYRPGEGLHISGQDLGPMVEEYWGEDEYEYELVVRPEHIPALFEALEIPGPEALLPILQARFCGNYAFSTLRTFLVENKIPFDHWSG